MAEYKKMKLEDVFADIEKIIGADASDEEKSMQLRRKAASAYEQEDDPAAAAYYDEAIALGCVEADMLPEVLFRGGVSFAKLDEKKSFELLRRAAELGHVKAMLNLAVCYQKGTGAAKNEKECYKWALAAANAGDIEAMYICALCSEQGFGTKRTPPRRSRALSVPPRQVLLTQCIKPRSTTIAARAPSAIRRRRLNGSKMRPKWVIPMRSTILPYVMQTAKERLPIRRRHSAG